jgi:hypothetical protein
MPPARLGLGPTLLLCLTVAAACAGGSETGRDAVGEGRQGLTPTYSASTIPASPGRRGPADQPDGSASTTVTSEHVASPSTAPGTEPAQAGEPTPRATIADPAGDATGGTGDTPAWADLVGAQLSGLPDYYELRVQLAGGTPTSSGAADRTMNVATFVDVDGDGQVDYELWANLADGGWDGSWFDNGTGRSAHSEEAAMDVLVEGADLIVRFPAAYVGDATSFRWSLASEYGAYTALGTGRTARDDAPDGDVPVQFPG